LEDWENAERLANPTSREYFETLNVGRDRGVESEVKIGSFDWVSSATSFPRRN